MIDMILESPWFAITDLFYFNLLIIAMVDAVTIKITIVAIKNEKPLYLLEDILTLILRWSFIIVWIIILIVLNVVVFVGTFNDYVTLANDLIESGSFITE